MTGRRPKPTNLKVLEGNPGRRPLPENEPAADGTPEAPSDLECEALAEWNRIVPELDSMGLLARADRAALVRYCQAWATSQAAFADMNDNGMYETVYNQHGSRTVKRPCVNVAAEYSKIMKSYLIEFGLTPAARTRVKSNPKPKQNPEDEFLGKTG